MALNHSNSSNLEQLALKGLTMSPSKLNKMQTRFVVAIQEWIKSRVLSYPRTHWIIDTNKSNADEMLENLVLVVPVRVRFLLRTSPVAQLSCF